MTFANLHLRTDYWHDPSARAAFKDLVREIFALDLAPWEAAGFWDELYRPFTVFEPSGRAVASVCLYSTRMVIDGRTTWAGQLSAVATRPEWRRRGLAGHLAGEALRWSERQGHSFQYLFADEEALALYRRLGFRPIEESVTTIEVSGRAAQPGARCLDPADAADRARVHQLAVARGPVSRRIGVLNERLLMYHALASPPGRVWLVEPLDVVVLVRRQAGVLTLLDVIGPRVPPLVELHPYIADATDTRVIVRFEPDLLGDLSVVGRVGSQPLRGNNLHVRGEFPWPGPVVFPLTAQA